MNEPEMFTMKGGFRLRHRRIFVLCTIPRLSRSLSNLTRIGERDPKSIAATHPTAITKKLIFQRNAKSTQPHVSGIHASYVGRCSSSRRKTPAVMVSPIPTVVTGLSQWSDGATQTV